MHLQTPLLEFGFILEATMGFGPSKLGTMNGGFADPCSAKKEPYSPFSHFRLRVLYAWN